MASGQQIAQDNVEIFMAWVASKNDEEFKAMEHRGLLSRANIVKECGFARSVIDQNPRIRKALQELETALRARGILPEITQKVDQVQSTPIRESGAARAALEVERRRRLENENAALRAEVAELKSLRDEVAELKMALARFTVLQEAIQQTGRLPR